MAVRVGVLLGPVAGYYGRWIDALVLRLAGITLTFPSWGALVADGRDLHRVAPWVSPAWLSELRCWRFNLVGDGLREAYDPKLRCER